MITNSFSFPAHKGKKRRKKLYELLFLPIYWYALYIECDRYVVALEKLKCKSYKRKILKKGPTDVHCNSYLIENSQGNYGRLNRLSIKVKRRKVKFKRVGIYKRNKIAYQKL